MSSATMSDFHLYSQYHYALYRNPSSPDSYGYSYPRPNLSFAESSERSTLPRLEDPPVPEEDEAYETLKRWLGDRSAGLTMKDGPSLGESAKDLLALATGALRSTQLEDVDEANYDSDVTEYEGEVEFPSSAPQGRLPVFADWTNGRVADSRFSVDKRSVLCHVCCAGCARKFHYAARLDCATRDRPLTVNYANEH
ncbi:hypothetical protein FISHEDRAFT_55002 [Fistulina hepatica ATCC 64428]|uniref:Uncharacterized protein n=1 Tax=Fistulina hepatica ATCC 64428 TaxID=1128425 RepID=A0A0D7APE2_9AGAR|nr:hypothetical protein FISHEDRAFT_55002 [Fistulina hepatica ATCC 64428]